VVIDSGLFVGTVRRPYVLLVSMQPPRSSPDLAMVRQRGSKQAREFVDV
jgi:hypothetical protein